MDSLASATFRKEHADVIRHNAGPPQLSEGGQAPVPTAMTAPSINPVPSVLQPAVVCAVLLCFSNLFMTFAWYGHLKLLENRAWWVAALISWGVALFEYLLQVPANRIGYTALTLAQDRKSTRLNSSHPSISYAV